MWLFRLRSHCLQLEIDEILATTKREYVADGADDHTEERFVELDRKLYQLIVNSVDETLVFLVQRAELGEGKQLLQVFERHFAAKTEARAAKLQKEIFRIDWPPHQNSTDFRAVYCKLAHELRQFENRVPDETLSRDILAKAPRRYAAAVYNLQSMDVVPNLDQIFEAFQIVDESSVQVPKVHC